MEPTTLISNLPGMLSQALDANILIIAAFIAAATFKYGQWRADNNEDLLGRPRNSNKGILESLQGRRK